MSTASRNTNTKKLLEGLGDFNTVTIILYNYRFDIEKLKNDFKDIAYKINFNTYSTIVKYDKKVTPIKVIKYIPKKKNEKIVVFVHTGLLSSQFTEIKEAISDRKFNIISLYARNTIVLNISNISITTFYVDLLPIQKELYLKHLDAKFLNAVFPEDIYTKLISRNTSINHRTNVLHIKGDGEVENIFELYDTRAISNKYYKLVYNLLINKDSRHLIYTKFNNYYGMYYLSYYLKSRGFSVYCVDSACTSPEYDMEEVKAMVNTCTSRPLVIIISEKINCIYKNITNYHILNFDYDINFNNISMLYCLDATVLTSTQFSINYYVCKDITGTEPTIDLDLNEYNTEQEIGLNCMDFYKKLEFESINI